MSWNQTTEFMFAGNYMPLNKNGTFGWTKLTFVGDVPEQKDYVAPELWPDGTRVPVGGRCVCREVDPQTPLTPAAGARAGGVAHCAARRIDRGGRPLSGLRLSQRAGLGPLLRVRRGAGRSAAGTGRSGRAADYVV